MRKTRKISVALMASLLGAFTLASCDVGNTTTTDAGKSTTTEVPTTAQPSVDPTTTVQPSVDPTTTVQPSVEPTTTAQPSVEPTTTTVDYVQLLNDAADKIILPQENADVSKDFTVLTSVVNSGVTYPITWSVNNEVASIAQNGEETVVKVDFVNNNNEVQTVKLTATVTDAFGNSTTRTFKFKVPVFTLSTLADYDAAAGTDTVSVKGIITAAGGFDSKYKNGYVFMQDISGTAGYYGYRVKAESQEAFDADLVVGNTIILTGVKALYNGVREFSSDGCTYIVTATGGEATVADVTDNIKNGTGIGDALMCHAATFTGLTVISTDQAKSTDGRWTIVVGDPADTNKQAKIYINKYLTPTTSDDHKAWEELNIKAGDIIDFSGIVNWNNGASLEPVGAEGLKVTGHDLGMDLGGTLAAGLSLPETIFGNKTIDLPTIAGLKNAEDYANYQAAWTVTESEFASIDDNKLTIKLASAETEITVKLTVTSGDSVVFTKEFKTTLITSYSLNTQAEVYAIAAKYASGKISSESVCVTGVITGWNSNQKAIYMQNADGEAYYLYFGAKVEDAWLKVGQQIDLMANVEPYNNQVELVNGVVLKVYDTSATITAVDMTEEFTANGFEALAQDKFYELVTFDAKFVSKDGANWKVKCGEKEIACYSYTSVTELEADAACKVTGLLGFYYNSKSATTAYQIYLVTGQTPIAALVLE